jgi:spore maturation protein CgeB
MDIVFVGLAITSSWGNGHATTYRSLIKGLHARGHRVTFLEQDQPWYADHRDAPDSPHCEVHLYADSADLRTRFASLVRAADVVVVGSYVADGARVGDWVLEEARGVRAFYDIDTPVTLAALREARCSYLRADQIPHYDVMLSFSGGPTLVRLQDEFGARRASALYCSVDVDAYRPADGITDVDLGYMGTYSDDRQPGLERLLNEPARRLVDRRFVVAGSQYPAAVAWPPNVERIEHLPPARHAEFYGRSRYTLNLTRADMRAAGWSPSVRLFEAAACGVPIVSDAWPGLDDVLAPGREILIAHEAADVVRILSEVSDGERRRIGEAARGRVLAAHGGVERARELEAAVDGARRPAVRPRSRIAG